MILSCILSAYIVVCNNTILSSDVLWVMLFICITVMIGFFVAAIFKVRNARLYIIGELLLIMQGIYIGYMMNHSALSINFEYIWIIYIVVFICSITFMCLGIKKGLR
ncbi:MAG: hypothetical protein SOV90_06615 [Lachnospiraceae bacterium]|nr:hypothetical protein [Lachnospiraceae bacterium]